MWAESIWKQIKQRELPAGGVVDGEAVRAMAEGLDDAELGRRLFELAAAARERGLDAEGALRRHAADVMAAVEEKGVTQ